MRRRAKETVSIELFDMLFVFQLWAKKIFFPLNNLDYGLTLLNNLMSEKC